MNQLCVVANTDIHAKAKAEAEAEAEAEYDDVIHCATPNLMPQQPPYQPIACHLYDYIEAACVHRYDVVLTLLDSSTCQGVATDVVTIDRQEWLVLQTVEGVKNIRLDTLLRLQVITEPRVFDLADFSQTSV